MPARQHWPMPGESLSAASSGGTATPPPLTSEEEEFHRSKRDRQPDVPLRKPSTSAVLRRSFAGFLAAGFGILFFYLALELIQTVNLLLTWPPLTGWPVLGLLFGLIAYGIYRLLRIVVGLRRLPILGRVEKTDFEKLPGKQREKVRAELLAQLHHLRKQRADREDDPIRDALDRLEGQATSHPAGEWIRDYHREILAPLSREARERVRKIAITAGASAALSPWRLLDAVVAFNAAAQAAHDVLRIHGIRPNQAVAMAFAFDTFLNTFLATVVEDVSSDLVDSLTAQISAETGATATKVLAPKIAEALTTAVFVRRLGNRMIKRLYAPL